MFQWHSTAQPQHLWGVLCAAVCLCITQRLTLDPPMQPSAMH